MSLMTLVGIFWLVRLTEMPALAVPCAPPTLASPCAYITSASGLNVSVIDTTTNTVVTTVWIGGRPIGVAVHPDGTFVYVGDNANNSVFIIDTTTNTLVGLPIPVGDSPESIAVNRAGTRIYVANSQSNTVSVIDTVTRTVVATVPLAASPHGVAVHRDGTRVYVATDTGLAVIDAAKAESDPTNAIVADLTLIPPAYGVALHPAGSCAYVTSQQSGTVSVVDTATNSIAGAPISVGALPRGIAVHPAGTFLYTANGDDTVSVVGIPANTEIAAIPMAGSPRSVAIHPTGNRGYVVNEAAQTVVLIDTSTNTISGGSIGVGDTPQAFGRFIGPEQDRQVAGIQCHVSKQVASLGPAKLWIGLKNSDDEGTQFDLQVEVSINNTLVATARTLCITGVTRNPDQANEAMVPFGSFPSLSFATGDVLSLKLLTRIGTSPDGTKCPGPGGSHNNAVGLRLYYDAISRPSRVGVQLTPDPLKDFFLHSNSSDFLDDIAPTATTAKFKDSSSLNFSGGNPWKAIGTWSITLP